MSRCIPELRNVILHVLARAWSSDVHLLSGLNDGCDTSPDFSCGSKDSIIQSVETYQGASVKDVTRDVGVFGTPSPGLSR